MLIVSDVEMILAVSRINFANDIMNTDTELESSYLMQLHRLVSFPQLCSQLSNQLRITSRFLFEPVYQNFVDNCWAVSAWRELDRMIYIMYVQCFRSPA